MTDSTNEPETNLVAADKETAPRVMDIDQIAAAEQRTSFEFRRPNTATRCAIAELESGKGRRSRSVKDLMRALKA